MTASNDRRWMLMEVVKSAHDAGKIQWHPLDPVSWSTGIQWVSMTFPVPGILLGLGPDRLQI